MTTVPLNGTVGIITGAGTPSGIGRTAVLQYAAAGAKTIYACDLLEEHFPSLVDLVKQAGHETAVVGVKVDVTKSEDLERLVRQIIGEQGRLDWLFANAGVVDFEPFGSTTEQNLQRAFNINTIGVFNSIQWAARGMMNTCLFKPEAGGSIVVTTSLASTFGGMGSPAYTASKYAAVGILKSACAQFKASKVPIRVNGIAPGAVTTSITENAMKAGAISGATMQVLVEKSQSVTPEFYANVAPPTEIADVAVFLCSPASVGVNGQNIVVDRGSRETVVEMSGVFSLVPPVPI
ncbi:hypothetical protein FFLO_01664 [Filobasidium floriforme]|uniref:NAD(P)-binding protein n=1 Tax=Filobasidium floriforme TaxID=5210 RepID=A0A8K0NSI3_9TREE|nr:uncharacterized protein HD553DRAFT_309744 [Filobasidium floriforme]KAG7562835.1 hypothetical protein FFLO_01664 [Filobasidium floriforme]KAH8086479.1 hypothetical protein HD553DRAFT_309744 [Filobasidium floriforme]